MVHPVIEEDWTDYDERKIMERRDRAKFSCDEPWERDYLADKLKEHFPGIPEAQIREAIYACCITKKDRERTAFVDSVVKRLA